MQIKEGTWWEEGGVRRTVSQLHEVMGFFGGKWLQIITQFLVGLSLLGTCIAQVVASSGNLYSIDKSHSKRSAAASRAVWLLPYLSTPPCHLILSVMLWQSMRKLYINTHAQMQNGLALEFCCQTTEEFHSVVNLWIQGL